MNKKFLPKLMLMLALVASLNTFAADIDVLTSITTNTTWTNNNTYILYGEIFIKNGVTLTIQEGTIIKGDKGTTSRLIVAMGGKLIAQGTPEQPIVFTSNEPAGQRSRGDWAGLAVCGKAPTNFVNSSGVQITNALECADPNNTDYTYGGSIPDDSSGVISYVRIEYAGYVCNSTFELNSLTLGAVGSRTKLDHVMVSYGQDDGFEFFGGSVNANHIISYGSRDDDFDTDNGYSGKVQYGLVVRIDTIADQADASNAFESDNNSGSTYQTPYTKGVFSNITVIGPAATTTSTIDSKFGHGARLRRNSGLNIFNSIFIGYKRGLFIDGSGSQTKATTDTLEFKYNIIAGTKERAYEASFDSAYLINPSTHNTVIGGNANDTVKLVSPYGNAAQLNFAAQAGSVVLTGADFTNTKLQGFETTAFRGAFDTNNWATCWAEYTPQDENYTSGPISYSYNVSVTQSGSLPTGVTLTANDIPGASYLWSTGGTTSAATVTAAGAYTLTVTSARGCQKVQAVTVGTVGVEDLNSTVQNIRLFPNPNSGNATIEISSAYSLDAVITVNDLSGRNLVMINKELATGTTVVSINTSEFANGVYFVNVNTGKQNKVVRMTVSK